jgi:hypothetical protein
MQKMVYGVVQDDLTPLKGISTFTKFVSKNKKRIS